jgi:hypothetical protein
MKTIIVIAALLLLVSPSFAGNKELDRKQIYELKEKCHQAAERYVERETATVSQYYTVEEVSQNYNSRLNSCLVKETNRYPDKSTVVIVIDIMTNTSIAVCGGKTTDGEASLVEGKFFKSRKECERRAWLLMNE